MTVYDRSTRSSGESPAGWPPPADPRYLAESPTDYLADAPPDARYLDDPGYLDDARYFEENRYFEDTRYYSEAPATTQYAAPETPSTAQYAAPQAPAVAQYAAPEAPATAQYAAEVADRRRFPTGTRPGGQQPAAAPVSSRYPADAPASPPADWAPAHAGGAPPAWAPPSEPAAEGRRKTRLAVVGAIVAVAVASAGVTAGIMAAVGGGAGTAAITGPGGGPGQGGGPGGNQNAATNLALHGTYVVSDGNGRYTTQLMQTGTVSAVSTSSITVKSADGYSKTYTITSATTVGNGTAKISDVAKGHTVRIVATSANSKATATSITDTNLAGAQQNGQPGAPAQQ